MRSMTGFGKAKRSDKLIELSVEVKSVNNRYFDLQVKLPKEFSVFETNVRELLKKRVSRGKLSVFITIEENTDSGSDVVIDENKLIRRFQLMQKVNEVLNLNEKITLEHLLNFTDLFTPDLASLHHEMIVRLLNETLNEAMDNFDAMREQEALNIKKDIEQRLDIIHEITGTVKEKGRENIRREFDKLYQNVRNLIGEQKIDQNRLEQELAIIADRVDITEECVRMDSHVKLFRDTLKKGGELGKKITFILQEMLREANTMNSKTTDIGLSHSIIRLKEEIEKIREQAQNIE